MAPERLSAERKQGLTHAPSRGTTPYKQAGGSALTAPAQHVWGLC